MIRSISLLLLILMISCTSKNPLDFHQNKVIAHRGAWKAHTLPQNSIASLREAIRLGCQGSEFDVWMTADEILVVNHDHDFQGMDIEQHTYEQLLTKKLPNGEKIPTLEEYLKEGMTQSNTRLILEFKPSGISTARSERVGELAVKTVQKIGAQDWVEYITFSYEGGLKAIATDPMAKVAYLTGDKSPQELKNDQFFGFDYHFSVLEKNPDWIKEAQNLGLTTNSWTVNSPELMSKLLDEGIDMITTDEPEQLLKILEKRNVPPSE